MSPYSGSDCKCGRCGFRSGDSRGVASASFGGEVGWRMNNVKISGVLGGDSSQVIEYGTYAASIGCSIESGECGIGITCWASAAFASALRCCFRCVWIAVFESGISVSVDMVLMVRMDRST
jgi:hypothetical protein